MVTYEGLVNYIERDRAAYRGDKFAEQGKEFYRFKLLDSQKRFLKNLIEGKVTDCPRGFGKTFLIKLYAEYLNKVHDEVKYYDEKADDYISCEESIKEYLLNTNMIKEALICNKERAISEYNVTPEIIKTLEN